MRIVMLAPDDGTDGRGGGIGALLAHLPSALADRGHDVSVFLPLHRGVRARFARARELTPVVVRLHDGNEEATILRAEDECPGVGWFAVGADRYFDRPHFLGEGGVDYADGVRRFAFFGRAALGAIDALGLDPDVIHCHDWPAALVPVYLRGGMLGRDRAAQAREALGRAAVVLTIHDLSAQGVFPSPEFAAAGVPREVVSPPSVEAHGTVNLLREGLLRADHVTTASPRNARDVGSAEHGAGLDDVFAARRGAVSGILGGIDPKEWNPSTDRHLAAAYGPADLHGKRRCKADLLLEMELEADLDAPVLGLLSPLTPEQGFDLLLPALPLLFERGLGVAVVGDGHHRTADALEALAERWPRRLAFHRGWEGPVVHRLLAGADMLLAAPSYESGGWLPMVAQAYGTVPIVRAAGGLVDAVLDVGAVSGRGTGFWIDHDSSDALVRAVDRALAVFAEPERWRSLQIRGMERDFSPRQTAARYVQLYRRLARRSAGTPPRPRLERSSWHGRVADDFTMTAVRALAQGLTEQIFEEDPSEGLVQRGILVAHDTRYGGASFAATAAGVLAWNDVAAVRSMSPTALPAAACAVAAHALAGALVVTAEGAGAAWNGVHLMGPAGAPLAPGAEAIVARRSAAWIDRRKEPEEMEEREAAELGLRREIDAIAAHRAHLASLVDVDAIRASGLRVACDLRWGTAAGTLDVLLRDWGVGGAVLNQRPDAELGGGSAEPVPESLGELAAQVGGELDLGVAVDPSGVLLAVVDRGGVVLATDHVLALLLSYLAETRDPRGRVVARSVDTSRLIDVAARRCGLDVIETPVGFQELGALLARGDAFFAADGSAFAFGDAVPHPDAMLAALLVVEMVARRGRPLAAQLDERFDAASRTSIERRSIEVPPSLLPEVRQRMSLPPAELAPGSVEAPIGSEDARLLTYDDRWLLARLCVGPTLRLTAEAPTLPAASGLLEAAHDAFLPER